MEDAEVATRGQLNGSNPLAPAGTAAASLHTSNGVTNPLLPRSLGRLGGLQRPKSAAFDTASDKDAAAARGPLKSRFLGSGRSKQSQEKSPPTTPDSGVASPPAFVNRSSSGSSSTSTTSNNSSGYCTYSNENGVLRFTIKEKTVPEEENMGNRMAAGIEKSKSRILVEEEMFDTVTEPVRLPNKPLLDLSRRGDRDRRSVGREMRGSSVGRDREGSKEPDRLSKTISDFMRRSDERMRDWKSYEKRRAAAAAGAMSLSLPAAPLRAQSVARATSVERDDEHLLGRRISYPQRGFGANRNARAASVARDDIFNEMQSQNLRRPLFVRGASVARDEGVSNEEYLSSVRESLYNQTGSRFLRRSSPTSERERTPLRDRGATPARQRGATPLKESRSHLHPLLRAPLRDGDAADYLTAPASDRHSDRFGAPLREAASEFDNSFCLRSERSSSRRTPAPVREEDSWAKFNSRFQSRGTPMRDAVYANSGGRREFDGDDRAAGSYRAPPLRGSSVARDSDVSSDLLGYRRTADGRNYRSQSVVPNRPNFGSAGDAFEQNSLASDRYAYSYREPLNYYAARGRGAGDEDATIRAPPPPKFLSLEEECNWILSGKVQPPPSEAAARKRRRAAAAAAAAAKKNFLEAAPSSSPRRSRSKNGGGDTLNDLLSANAASDEEEDTLDDISGDEVNQRVTDDGRADGTSMANLQKSGRGTAIPCRGSLVLSFVRITSKCDFPASPSLPRYELDNSC